MIWEAVVSEELPFKAENVNYMDHFVTYSCLIFVLLTANLPIFIPVWVFISYMHFHLAYA